jgi:hypothetical protein|uniref:DUF3786 domain-containing protein n=1 Tax=Desulfobacca acetoxidans TaxID=60893 RepID=A0A7V6DNI9_9BACT
MLYERCDEVNAGFWQELANLPPEHVARRTNASLAEGSFSLPFLNRILIIDPVRRTIEVQGEPRDLSFRICLTALLFLCRVDPAALGPLVSPLELTGGATFFPERGPHAVPHAPLEERFGRDLAGFLQAGKLLGAQPRAAGDAALAFQVFPGLTVEVILWLADEEFPAQVSFRVPAALERLWHLDAVLALMQLLAQELLAAAA